MKYVICLSVALLLFSCSKDESSSPTGPAQAPETHDLYGTWQIGPLDSSSTVSYGIEWTFSHDEIVWSRIRTDKILNQTTVIASGTLPADTAVSIPSIYFYSDTAGHYAYHYRISSDTLFLREVNPDYDSVARISSTGGILGRWSWGESCNHYCDTIYGDYTTDSLLFSGAITGPMERFPCEYPAAGEYQITLSDSSKAPYCYSIAGDKMYIFESSNDQLILTRK